jgi:signal transduction histidine kinase
MDQNEAVQEVAHILSRTLPRNITVIDQLQPLLPQIQRDPSQIHQVLMNLCINAADAMPEGGALTLSTRGVFLSEERARQHPSLQSGHYVRLSIADTGIGISEEDLPKIFEPFFTIKEIDKGTGLGLWVVYGIVKNHRAPLKSSAGGAGERVQRIPAGVSRRRTKDGRRRVAVLGHSSRVRGCMTIIK